LLRTFEEQISQLSIEIELNSLEDAFIKIAEDEIAAHEEQKNPE
jgi:hypothetical protein